MRKNEVRIVNEIGQEATVIESAFRNVWAARGWVKKEVAQVEADLEAEVEEIKSEVASDTAPPAPPAAPVPSPPAARLGRDGGTGTLESTQTTS